MKKCKEEDQKPKNFAIPVSVCQDTLSDIFRSLMKGKRRSLVLFPCPIFPYQLNSTTRKCHSFHQFRNITEWPGKTWNKKFMKETYERKSKRKNQCGKPIEKTIRENYQRKTIANKLSEQKPTNEIYPKKLSIISFADLKNSNLLFPEQRNRFYNLTDLLLFPCSIFKHAIIRDQQ